MSMLAATTLQCFSLAPRQLNIDGGTVRFSQVATVPSASRSGGGTFEVDSGLTINFSSVASGSGGFTKTGLGTLNLSGTNTCRAQRM